MPFWGADSCGSKNHVVDGGQNWTNLFAATRGDKTAMQPFAKLLWTQIPKYHIIVATPPCNEIFIIFILLDPRVNTPNGIWIDLAIFGA